MVGHRNRGGAQVPFHLAGLGCDLQASVRKLPFRGRNQDGPFARAGVMSDSNSTRALKA